MVSETAPIDDLTHGRGNMDSDENTVDTRIVYGTSCTWWGSINEVAVRNGLPCCPFCHGMLLEYPTEEDWWSAIRMHAVRVNDLGYEWFIRWLRGRCFSSWIAAQEYYANRLY